MVARLSDPDLASLASSSTGSKEAPLSPRNSGSNSLRSSLHGSLLSEDEDYGDIDNIQLIPLSQSLPQEALSLAPPPLEKLKTVTFVNGLALVIGLQIGSGIFVSPGPVNANAGSVGMSLIVWFVAGVLAWTGAASYAELGAAIPLNGGAYAYLSQAFNPIVGYLFSWTAITALRPGSAAIIALVFGNYVNRIVFGGAAGPWADRIVGVLCLCIVASLHSLGPRWGTATNTVFTAIKILSLVAITVLGLIAIGLGKGAGNFQTSAFEGSSTNLGDYAVALYSGLWAYDGWDSVSYVTAEMKNPQRDLPKVIHIAQTIVIVAYLAANIAYYAVLPAFVIKSSKSIAVDFGERLFGKPGGIVLAICVAASCFGALNSHTFTTARIIYIAGRESHLPYLFGTLHHKRLTPVNALLLQTALASIMLLVGGDFSRLVLFCGTAAWVFYFLTVLGLIVLRVRQPDLPRPYKTWITTPVVFCCVSIFLLTRGVLSAPIEAIAALIFIASGLIVYIIRQRLRFKLGHGRSQSIDHHHHHHIYEAAPNIEMRQQN